MSQALAAITTEIYRSVRKKPRHGDVKASAIGSDPTAVVGPGAHTTVCTGNATEIKRLSIASNNSSGSGPSNLNKRGRNAEDPGTPPMLPEKSSDDQS